MTRKDEIDIENGRLFTAVFCVILAIAAAVVAFKSCSMAGEAQMDESEKAMFARMVLSGARVRVPPPARDGR